MFGYVDLGWWTVPPAIALLWLVAVGRLVASVAGGSPSLGSALLSVAGAVALSCVFLFRVGFQVEVDPATLVWRSRLRRRTVELRSVRGSQSLWFGLKRLNVDGQKALLFMGSGQGWVTFLDALDGACPHAGVGPSRWDRVNARLPNWLASMYYRRLE